MFLCRCDFDLLIFEGATGFLNDAPLEVAEGVVGNAPLVVAAGDYCTTPLGVALGDFFDKFLVRFPLMQNWSKLFFHPNIIIYTPFESPCQVDTISDGFKKF